MEFRSKSQANPQQNWKYACSSYQEDEDHEDLHLEFPDSTIVPETNKTYINQLTMPHTSRIQQ